MSTRRIIKQIGSAIAAVSLCGIPGFGAEYGGKTAYTNAGAFKPLTEEEETQHFWNMVSDGRPLAEVEAEPVLEQRFRSVEQQLLLYDRAAFKRAVVQLCKDSPDRFGPPSELMTQADAFGTKKELLEGVQSRSEDALKQAEALLAFHRQTLLRNPAIDFENIVCIERQISTAPGVLNVRNPRMHPARICQSMLLPFNWQQYNPYNPAMTGYQHRIVTLNLSVASAEGPYSVECHPVHAPKGSTGLACLDLNWDGRRILFSAFTPDFKAFRLYEMNVDGTGLRCLTDIDDLQVQQMDGAYLPSGDIVFVSDAFKNGIPCTNGGPGTSLYCMNGDGGAVRHMSIEQSTVYYPCVLSDGRVMYVRWNYTNTPHAYDHVLFSINPNGTGLRSIYGSNSYWPTAMHDPVEIPGAPGKVVMVVGNHHSLPRMGELILFDIKKGQFEADGVVQRIPGWGKKVEPVLRDNLTDESWPQFLTPKPINEQFFLVTAKPSPKAHWGLYLVDVFDNMVLLKETPGMFMVDPIPLKSRPKPPATSEDINKVAFAQKPDDAYVYVQDVYEGGGLKGVPRGTVQSMRVVTYHFSPAGIGGLQQTYGINGPSEPMQILGTVPVYEDGSCFYRIPANTPFMMQPLDENGMAVQVMRSWTSARPHEMISCVGCHESVYQNPVPTASASMALSQGPADITPEAGLTETMDFERYIQPILSRHCIGCHDGETADLPDFRPGRPNNPKVRNERNNGRIFTQAYEDFVGWFRTYGLEGDYRLLQPMEFHALTSPGLQLLERGHHGVKLTETEMRRIAAWVDLNKPYYGSWHGPREKSDNRNVRVNNSLELREKYYLMHGGVAYQEPRPYPAEKNLPPPEPVQYKKAALPIDNVELKDWPAAEAERAAMQTALGKTERVVDLDNGVTIRLRRIPAGRFIMGSLTGAQNEAPRSVVEISKPFWISETEINNLQYFQFDPQHDSFGESPRQWAHQHRGFAGNEPGQPVVRISWNRAQAFAGWLSEKTGGSVKLPTEAQWEWACRAGSASSFWYDESSDGGKFDTVENLADDTLSLLCKGNGPYGGFYGVNNKEIYWPAWVPRVKGQYDFGLVARPVGSYRSNPWGLHDMHGNVREWTRSAYRPYPYRADDGRNDEDGAGEKIVRGGSWYATPAHATASVRAAYSPWQQVFDVGFRIVVEE